ncbi:MAG: hypothetical protein ACOYM3_18085 [Terrimicrobiaceae bacterium]
MKTTPRNIPRILVLALCLTVALVQTHPATLHAETLGPEVLQMSYVDSLDGGLTLCDEIQFNGDGVVTGMTFFIGKPVNDGGASYFYILRPQADQAYDVLYVSDPVHADDGEGEKSITLNCEVKAGDVVAYVGRGVSYKLINSGDPNVYRSLKKVLQAGDQVRLVEEGSSEQSPNTVHSLPQRRIYSLAVEFAPAPASTSRPKK